MFVASNPEMDLRAGVTKFSLDVELERLRTEQPDKNWDRVVLVEEFPTPALAKARRKFLVRMGRKRLRKRILRKNPGWTNLIPAPVGPAFFWPDEGEPPGTSGVRAPLLPPFTPLVGRAEEPIPKWVYEDDFEPPTARVIACYA